MTKKLHKEEFPVFEAKSGKKVVEYALVLPAIEVPGKGVFTAEQLLEEENAEVLAHLVEIQSGMVQKISKDDVAKPEKNTNNPVDEWDAAAIYKTNDLAVQLNRFWKSKVTRNANHQPPTDPSITQDPFWVEESKDNIDFTKSGKIRR